MTSPTVERDAPRRSAARNKSYVDLTADSDEDEVMPLQPSKFANQGVKRKRVRLHLVPDGSIIIINTMQYRR